MDTISTILFDYGGVIAEEGFREGLQAIGAMNGHDPVRFHLDVARTIADCGYLTGRADESSFWAAVRREYRLAQTDAQLRDEILRRFVLRPAMLGLVSRLREQGYTVGIISDQTDWLDKLNARDNFFSCFDIVFNSFHLHASKYHGDMFAAVVNKLHIPAQHIFIVDDNAGNIAKAKEHGFAALHFTDERSCAHEMSKVLQKSRE